MSKVTAHLDVALEHYSHAAARVTCRATQQSCYLEEWNCYCDVKNPSAHLTQYFEEAEVETGEFKQYKTTDRSI